MTKRLLTLSVIAAAIFLGGCMGINPEPPVEVEPVVVTLKATVNGTQAVVEGCIEGGTGPYWVTHECDGSVICGDEPCPVCPTPCATQVPCPAPTPVITDCCFEFVCSYSLPGTYTIVVSVMDTGGQHVWKSVTVKIEAVIPPEPETYTIVAAFGPGGSVSPSGSIQVTAGGSKTFTVTAFPGYVIGDILVDGVSIFLVPLATSITVYEYTFADVDANHTIWAGFGLDGPPGPPVNPGKP